MFRKISADDINAMFDGHTVGHAQSERIKKVRAAAKNFAFAILDNVPHGSEQWLGIMLAKQAMYSANGAIAVEQANAKYFQKGP